MRHASLKAFIDSGALARGPVALIFAEDDVEVLSTLRHHLERGFKVLVLLAPRELSVPPEIEKQIHFIACDTLADGILTRVVNDCIAAAPNVWFYYGYNAEYLFYPFCEYRSVAEVTAFAAEERRDSILTYVVDLYAADLWEHPTAVSIDNAHLDKSGYYALNRKDRWNNDKDRQMDFFGGLRWRFEEHIPVPRRRIDRVGLFKAAKGLELRPDHTFNVEEYNTYACPWHNSLTATVCSFRTAKALKRNPGSTFDIPTFWWHNSTSFDWHSQQLLDLGLMEPGQWF
ncbi:hypothetical protein [Pelagovum pacificum]|uniref:Uncharacterized protein n=1 Tax=Pelagovum pacificum TaxID=2588711 RepID=A0A5C5GHZ7_9RHOB|nr:hypothetical protein [Pelagovum pacificum]QQA43324.1 hypothetical protein I8N54_01760 [Pelagovum pacificum]TNY33539.1 hypothetical protein FHY64_09765 [Pelagovum pacificum]